MQHKLTDKQIARIIAKTRKWVETIIIGLDLCPFAKAPFQKGQVHFAVGDADTMKGFVEIFIEQLALMDKKTSIETTLLIVPALLKMEYFQPFMQFCEETIIINHWGKTYQIVSFHPYQRIDGLSPESPQNLISMGPYPIVHILRVESVETKGKSLKQDIQVRNDAILKKMKKEDVLALWKKVEE
ncbi:MAG: DUF1415 domain-containing protein [Bacteroidia bacterium]|nr:DUF1415 domain-containing protein [Bacteroidia bacterium]